MSIAITQFGWTGFGNPRVDDKDELVDDVDDDCFLAFGACFCSTIGL